MVTLKEAALGYLGDGWSVVPLRPGHKRARISWKRFQKNRPATFDVNAWWNRWPDANVGLICGRVSNYIVLDVDPRNGGEIPDDLPETLVADTPSGGTHHYFEIPEDQTDTIRSGIYAPGVDFIAEGEFVVAPPSIVNGKQYGWQNGPTPIAKLPGWLRPSRQDKAPGSEMAVIEESTRNTTITSLAGAMRRQGLWYEPILAAIVIVNEQKCDPPLPIDELRNIAKGILEYKPTFTDDLPTIVVNNRQDRELIEELFQSLFQSNEPPWLFQRDGFLTRVVETEDGGLSLESINVDAMMAFASRYANWISRSAVGVKEVSPPRQIVRSSLSIRETRFPTLRALVEIPIFDSDETLKTTSGYLPASQMYCSPSVEVGPPETTPEALEAAKDLILNHVFEGFPFVDQSSQAHAVAALILPFCRALIQGPTPLHLFEAPMPGTGKSLLLGAISRVVTGRAAEVVTGAKDTDEWRKRLTAVLLEAPSLITFDNLTDRVDNSHLAAALTAMTWSDRELGASRNLTLPINCTWLASGNNLQLSNEIARRTVLCRIDAGMSRPWQRTPETFKHPGLIPWVIESRTKIIQAALTIVQVGLNSKTQARIPTLGGFEEWSAVIGKILHAAGIEGFLVNAEQAYDEAVAEEDEWSEFINLWWTRHADRGVRTNELFELAWDENLLSELMGGGNENSQIVRLGIALRKMRGRTIEGKTIQLKGTISGGRKLYHLKETKDWQS